MKVSIMFSAIVFLAQAVAAQTPVIVELFTSQGCSSCPSADKVLSRIVDQAKRDGNPVYALSFHVDYWNYLGWKDPYSSKEYTARQRKYAEQLNLRSMYTPQLVINGEEELVGSNQTQATKIIANALQRKQRATLTINKTVWKENELHVSYSLRGALVKSTLQAALVERNVKNEVPRGENSGSVLHHDNVVRYFQQVSARTEGEIVFTNTAVNKDNASVILYLQDEQLSVVAAVSALLK